MANTRYIKVALDDLSKCGGDIKLLFWYSALKNYSKVFRADASGFHRVSHKTIRDELGFNPMKICRYNQSLVKLGLIKMDRKRGGKTWMGYKII